MQQESALPALSQLTGCTKTKATVYTSTTGTATNAPTNLITWGLEFNNGKIYASDSGGDAIIVCDDPVALTGCSKLYGCSGASTPSSVNKGCLFADNTLESPLRMAILPP